MNKRRVKITAVIVAVASIIASICAIGYANTVNDGLFNLNTPTHITPNSTITGTLTSSSDYEAFVFEIERNGALNVRLDHDDLLDSVKCGYRVSLYKILEGETREYQELTYFDSFWSDVTASWGETGVSPGTYVVVVDPGTDVILGDFTLVTTFTATSSFEKEFNDTKESANRLSLGDACYGSSSQRTEGYDHDWFVFELKEDSCIDLSFAHDDLTFPKAGWNIKIMTADEVIVCDFTSKLTDTLIETGTIGLKAGTYYIKIENVSAIATTYQMVLGVDKAINHEFELNDTPETAIDLPQNIAMGGSLAERLLSLDKDYYRINVAETGVFDLSFTHESLMGDKNGWNIRVIKIDSDGNEFEIAKKISAWNSSTCEIKNLGLAKGEYYILIDGDSLSYNSASYKLSWTLTPRADFETEPNGILSEAKPIDANTFYYGAIISSGVDFDEDYYSFEITEERNVSLELGHEKINDSSLTWIASIVDAEGNTIASIESSLNEALSSTGVVRLKAGTYYVKVETGMYGSEVPYYFRLVR